MTETTPGAEWEPLPAESREVAPVIAPVSATNTDLIQSVTQLDRAIKERRETDQTLVNWWLYFLVLSWVTLGIYGIYLFFKRITRVDGFSRRKHAYYDALLEWTQRQAAARGQEDEVHHLLGELSEDVRLAYDKDLRPIKAGLSFLLTIVTLGIYGFFVTYRLNRYWWDAQLLEQDFDDKLSRVWMALGIVRYPIAFSVDQSKRRSFALYLILSFVTFGIWGYVWDYKIHTDPDKLYGELHSIEDSVLQTVRAH